MGDCGEGVSRQQGSNRSVGSNCRHRVLWVYHGAAMWGPQKVFEAMGRQPRVHLRVLGPRKGFDAYYRVMLEIPKPRYGPDFDLVPGRVCNAMRHCAGPYLVGLLREIVRFRPDIIHVINEAYSTVHIQALLYRNIFAPRAKCYSHGVQNVIDKRPATRWEALKRKFAHTHCQGVTCWGGPSRDALLGSGFPAEKLTVAYWGVPLDDFRPVRNEALRATLGYNNDEFVLGFVGKIDLQKGLWTLLLALRSLPKSVKCLIIGEGPWREGLARKTGDFHLEDRVQCVGNIGGEEVPAYMNAMDALVLPSETGMRVVEQFGRVLPEAMACEVPVIGSDSGAIAEVIGNAGLVFAERDYVDLAKCINRLLGDPALRARLGKMGRGRATRLFSCEAYVARMLKLYDFEECR